LHRPTDVTPAGVDDSRLPDAFHSPVPVGVRWGYAMHGIGGRTSLAPRV